MNRKEVFLVLLVFGVGLVSASEFKPVVPYVPTDQSQLLTLGGAEEVRFEAKGIVWPQEVGEAEICLWKDDKLAAVSVTIDDNNWGDHQFWLEMGKKYGIKFTFFLITEPIEQKKVPSNYGTWEGWQEMLDAGHDVQCHSYPSGKPADDMTEEEERFGYKKAIGLIEGNLKNHRCIAIAYPWGRGDPEIAREYFIAARGVDGRPSSPNKINYMKVAMGGKSQSQLDVLMGKTVEKPSWLNRKTYHHGWIAPLFHNLGTKKPQNRIKAEGFINILSENKDNIWIDTFVNVAKYGQERDSADLKVIEVSDEAIRLSLTDRMIDAIFNIPLTVKVHVPEAWKQVKAIQGDDKVVCRLIEHEGGKFALVQMIPDREDVILIPLKN